MLTLINACRKTRDTIMLLNDDCLREIFKHCDLENQIVLFQVCERFKPIVLDIWKLHWKELHLNDSSDFVLKPCDIGISGTSTSISTYIKVEDLKFFLAEIHPFVKSADITGSGKQMWDIINELQFPKTTKLTVYDIGKSFVSETCFPNLRTLIISGRSVVKHSSQWSKLENLAFRSLNRMAISDIMEYVSKQKLKTLHFYDFYESIPPRYQKVEFFSELEELSAGQYGTSELLRMNAFDGMKNLKKFTLLYYIDSQNCMKLIMPLSKLLGTRVVELTVDFDCVSFDDNWEHTMKEVNHFCSLRKVTLICSNLTTISIFASIFPMLKTVVLEYNTVEAIDVMNILTTAQELDLLELRSCGMMPGSRHILLDVAKIKQYRSKPITIRVLCPAEERDDLKIALSTPTNFIKITNISTVDMHINGREVQYILE